MIKISEMVVDFQGVGALEAGLAPLQIEILRLMARSATVYAYDTYFQLRFELLLRSEIVKEARNLNASKVRFATFKNSRCNEDYWHLTNEGGFRLKEGVPPSKAIEDIFLQGRKYAFECATAMVIVLYKAVLNAIGESRFNQLFQGIYLFDWQYDQDLGLRTVKETVFLPGDVLYFDNPDVDPNRPEWQGANAVNLGRGLYYAHGIGIGTAELMIRFLNRLRRPGATRSAFLLDQATRPDFKSLSRFAEQLRIPSPDMNRLRERFILSRMGSNTYISY